MEKLFEEFSAKTLHEWTNKIISDLKLKDFNTLTWESPENIEISPIYNHESIKNRNREQVFNHSNWEIEQSLKHPSNAQILKCLNAGASALLLKDIPANEIETVLENVLIQYIQTSIQSKSMETNVESFISLIEKRGIQKKDVKGSFYYDPLMEGLKHGAFKNNLWEEFKLIQEKAHILQSFKSLTIQGIEYNNAGASCTQELAFTIAQLSEYFVNNKSLDPNKIQISLGVSSNYFFEIAKLRSIRLLWSQILSTYKKEEVTLNLRAETSLRTSTIFDPYINILRNTSQCMSAALGGANIINVNNYNVAFKKDDDFAQRIARNISLILKEESWLNKFSDVSSGSYYIEYLTNKLSLNAWKLFQEIEHTGGWIKAVKSNFIQNKIEENVAKEEQNLNSKTKHLLGTNLFSNSDEKMSSQIELPILKKTINGKDFKALQTNRLSSKMDVERLKNEENHA